MCFAFPLNNRKVHVRNVNCYDSTVPFFAGKQIKLLLPCLSQINISLPYVWQRWISREFLTSQLPTDRHSCKTVWASFSTSKVHKHKHAMVKKKSNISIHNVLLVCSVTTTLFTVIQTLIIHLKHTRINNSLKRHTHTHKPLTQIFKKRCFI